jgi:hypothetical protein
MGADALRGGGRRRGVNWTEYVEKVIEDAIRAFAEHEAEMRIGGPGIKVLDFRRKDGRRGVNASFSIVRRHGSLISCFCSTRSRFTVTVTLSSVMPSIERTPEACSIPRDSASSGPTCAVSPSVVCFPQRMRSNGPVLAIPQESA